MNTKKIGMHEFIVNFFKVTNRTDAEIPILLDAIAPVARSAGLMLYDSFDNTLESIFEPILTYPEHFALSLDAEKVRLKDAECLDELTEHWSVDSSVVEAIKDYLKKYENPGMYAGVMLDYAEKNEKYICTSTKYVDWLWDRLEQNCKPNTRFLKGCCRRTVSDYANISRISNLYTLLSRYYTQNMINYYGDGKRIKGYTFRYRRKGEERYFRVERLETCDIRGNDVNYRVVQQEPVANTPDFPYVALGIPCEKLEERKQIYEELEEFFRKARDISLSYDVIAYDLGIIYGKIEDPRD